MKWTLSKKLFIHIALTILIALSISSYMQYETFKAEYLSNLEKDSKHDLEMIQKNIKNAQENLKKVALNLSHEISTMNTLNLISNYQDTKHYDSALFDEEKKSLLSDLTAKINNFEHYSFAIFDKHNNPVILNQVQNGKTNQGYFTYTNSILSFYNTLENRLEDVPVLMRIDNATDNKIYTVVEEDAISLVLLQKIYLNNELIGFLSIKKRFTQDNIAVLTHELRNQFAFVVNELILGNIKSLNHKITEQYKESKEYFNDDNYYYYIHSTSSFNQNDIYYVVASPKEFLDNKISNLLWQLCFAFIFALLVAFIISFVFLHFNVIKPLRLLMNGIKQLNQKNFQPILIHSSDELEEIAEEFNTISFELKASFNRIEQAKLFLENLVDTIPARIFWKDLEGYYLGANNLLMQDAGIKNKEELLGKTDYDLAWTKEEADAFRADDFEVTSSGEAKRLIEEPQTRPDGSKVILLTSKVPLKDLNGKVIGLLGVYEDITNLKKLETEIKNKELILLNQSKMAAMGEMLENIAHQWRQPLSIITTIASGLKLNKEFGVLDDTMLVESLEQIVTSGQFLSQTVDDFRDFYKQDIDKHTYDIAKTLEKTLTLLSSKLHHRNIALVLNLQEVKIEGFENEMVQAFLNIFNNAIDAFEENTIEHKAIFVDFELVENCLHIKIYDNAGGIAKTILPKIFDARFTTKSHTKGTGIGLYITKLILEKAHAQIEATTVPVNYLSETYQGALFCIKIPLL